MTRLSKIAFAALALSVTLAGMNSAEAGCHGGGYRGPSVSRSYGSYVRPAYRPVVHAPSYQAPTYTQQVQRPFDTQQSFATQQSFNTQQLAQPAPFQPTGLQRSPVPQQVVRQPQPQQPVQQRPAQAPQTGQVSAMDMALQALGGFAKQPGPTASAPAPQPVGHVGEFQARLTNGSTVQLTLANNGQFSWSATNQEGKVSQFAGSYSITAGQLTLVRSADNQQLAGSLSALTQNGFRFQLGSNAAALEFVRG